MIFETLLNISILVCAIVIAEEACIRSEGGVVFHAVPRQHFMKSPNIECQSHQQQYQNEIEETEHNCYRVNLTLQTLS